MPIIRYAGIMPVFEHAKQQVKDAVQQSAEDLVSQAQAAAPVDTGTLRASIHVGDVTESLTSIEAKVETGGESSDYAMYVHEGTSRGVPATKFLERPLIDNQAVYLKAMQDAWKF